jgi:hypothetical protein
MFVGDDKAGASSISTAAERAKRLFPIVMDEVEQFASAVALERRHAAFQRTFDRVRPHVMTVVEFDQQWRRLPLPSDFEGVFAGNGTNAAVLFGTRHFERAAKEEALVAAGRGILGEGKPKSSCVAVLRRKVDGILLLVVAIHLESGDPVNTRAVKKRHIAVQVVPR